MSFSERPNPQEILEAIKLEDAQRNKGRLKIFLGMAAGVGKTYAMLEEAESLKREKVNVVVGNIEGHGRKETEVLAENLTHIPKKIMLYKDKEFKELDVEAIINLNPNIVLIDELAHSNIPGSKHAKRWQDVLEILDHGINVYTTLNVQHIESLNDIVWGITEVVVRETVPDIIIEKAHSIHLIDLTPDELLQRLKEGKVYASGQSGVAALHFFEKNKLSALREIVLRYVADRIDVDLRRMVTAEGRFEWRTREKFLVALSHSPHSQKLIRITRRLATQANAPWIAVNVNTGSTLSKLDEEQLAKNLRLTADLGAEIVTINDQDIALGIKRVAIQRGVTQIILGRTQKNLILSLFQGPTLVDKLSAECNHIDLHIIRQESHEISLKKKPSFEIWKSTFADFFSVSILVCMIGALSFVGLNFINYRIVELLFFILVSALSFYFKPGAMILASILFGIIWGFFLNSDEGRGSEAVLLGLYVLTCMFIGTFGNRSGYLKAWLKKNEKKQSQLKEVLSILEKDLPLADILTSLEDNLPMVVEGQYKIITKNDKGTLHMDDISLMSDKERTTALLSFENGHEGGWSTDTLPLSENLYIPIKNYHQTFGLLMYTPFDKKAMTLEERNLIDKFCKKLVFFFESQSVF